jgi:hypothetical protein
MGIGLGGGGICTLFLWRGPPEGIEPGGRNDFIGVVVWSLDGAGAMIDYKAGNLTTMKGRLEP